MRILIISSEIIKNKYSASIRVTKILKELSENSQVDILTEPMSVWDFKHQANKVFITNYKIPSSQKKTLKAKVYSKYFKISISQLKRYKAFISKLKQINLDQYDVIIAFGGGGFFEPLEALSQCKTNALTVGFIHDPYPGDVFPEPYQTKTNKNTLKIREKLKRVFLKLDKLAFPSKLLGEWMDKYYEFGDDKILELPHLLPTIEIDDDAKKEAEKFLNLHNLKHENFYFHAGTLLKHRPVKDIITQFKKLKKDGYFDHDFKLLFIGNVNYDIQKSDKDVVIVNKRKPLDLVNAISRKAKALMIIEHIADISPFLPGKVPEYIAHQKPIMHFGPQNSETCRVVKPHIEISKFSATLDNPKLIYAVLQLGGVELHQNISIINHFKIDTFIKKIEDIINAK
ncbi:hypothetical protein [Psychroflexus sp. ALD_RP9]|uniref:hypothetical protein n=1 Tax=Psychroflexus sp. ALD_RP9 TaxID=2777186 RepID=UPI001A8D47D0|nr:hypothetical protein [Psychroflexus sp. ALD_RP9]QSS96402.1 hypothetical protein IMZ30_08030 [Psychroflexus sp. ALD_RP9]